MPGDDSTGRTFHILYVITDLLRGGVPLHLARLACEMVRRGHRCTVVSLAPDGPVGDLLRNGGVEVVSCQAAGKFDIRVFSRLATLIREKQPDIVHALLFHANLASRISAMICSFPSSRVINEVQTVEFERRWHLRVDALTHSACRCIVGNSPSVVDHLATHACIPPSQLRLIWGGVDVERICSATPIDRTSIGLPQNAMMILWVGRLDPVKGLDDLIPAFKNLDPRLNAHLVLVGDGAYRDRLNKLIDGHRRIHMPGSRNDVPSLLAAADLFVFPSYTEGLPNALMEAMGAGLPVVATNVPGCRDLVTHNQTGLLVPPHAPEELTTAMHQALSRPDLGQAAATYISKHHRIEQCFDAYEQLYGETLGCPESSSTVQCDSPDRVAGFNRSQPTRTPAATGQSNSQ
jgi:glycosyltransferase involved in cell wall biosynthesis